MKGCLLVSPDILETEDQLLKMLDVGNNFAAALPKK
jgi:hypothetical protein